MTIAFTVSPCRRTTSSTSSILSPGSTTMQSRVASSPKIEQLHCSIPTGRISWIMPRLYTLGGRRNYEAYARHTDRDHALDAHLLDGDARRGYSLRTPGDGALHRHARPGRAGSALRPGRGPLPAAGGGRHDRPGPLRPLQA